MRLIDIPVLSDGFDACIRDSTQAKSVRISIAVVLAVLAAAGLGWKPMAIWFAIAVGWELLSAWSSKRRPYPEHATWRQRGPAMVLVVAVNLLWMTPSLLMWFSDSPALHLAAALQWMANLMYAQLFAQKSRLFAFLSVAPQIVIVAICTVFFTPFHGLVAIAPIGIMLMGLFNVCIGLTGAVLHQERLVAAIRAQQQSEADMREALAATALSERRFRMAAAMVKMRVWEFDITADAKARGEGIWARIHPEDRDQVQEAWRLTLERGKPFHMIHRMTGEGPTWVESIAEVVMNPEGRPDKIVGALRDIDEEKRIEGELIQARDESEAANQAKSTFLATMSHEIRTPLNGILGMAQGMAADELTPTQRERLDVVRQSGETLLAILNDVLDLSKIEAGKMELEAAPFDLADVARGAQAAFAPLAEQKGLQFELAIADEAQGVYLGDATRLRQILYNLTSNALKFTEQGHVRVSVDRQDDQLRLTVTDSGIGIPLDRQAALFSNFTQADASTTRRFGGTGLGLSICRRLVELMDGQITLQSAPGEGSTFHVSLPLPWTGPAATASNEDERKAEAASIGLRILAAEDNRVNQLVLTTLLGQLGLNPVIVDNGRLAVEAFEREAWDVILMDVQMPEMDGFQATREIRRLEAERGMAPTPILALTADALAHQAALYDEAGMNGLVAKPIQLQQLVDAIEAVVADEPPAQQSAVA